MSPYDERDDESGRFTPEFSDQEFIDAVKRAGGATTSDVADEVGCKYRTAYSRLQDLHETGEIEKRDVGSSFLWSVK